MNKSLVIAATLFTGILSYFLLRKNYSDNGKYLNYDPIPKKHHVTDAFSNAKRHAMELEG